MILRWTPLATLPLAEISRCCMGISRIQIRSQYLNLRIRAQCLNIGRYRVPPTISTPIETFAVDREDRFGCRMRHGASADASPLPPPSLIPLPRRVPDIPGHRRRPLAPPPLPPPPSSCPSIEGRRCHRRRLRNLHHPLLLSPDPTTMAARLVNRRGRGTPH